jgi:hypothetical protein
MSLLDLWVSREIYLVLLPNGLVMESDKPLWQRLRTISQLAEHLRRVYNLKLGELLARP